MWSLHLGSLCHPVAKSLCALVYLNYSWFLHLNQHVRTQTKINHNIHSWSLLVLFSALLALDCPSWKCRNAWTRSNPFGRLVHRRRGRRTHRVCEHSSYHAKVMNECTEDYSFAKVMVNVHFLSSASRMKSRLAFVYRMSQRVEVHDSFKIES